MLAECKKLDVERDKEELEEDVEETRALELLASGVWSSGALGAWLGWDWMVLAAGGPFGFRVAQSGAPMLSSVP